MYVCVSQWKKVPVCACVWMCVSARVCVCACVLSHTCDSMQKKNQMLITIPNSTTLSIRAPTWTSIENNIEILNEIYTSCLHDVWQVWLKSSWSYPWPLPSSTRNKQKNWTHQHKSQACFLCQSMASHTVTAWLPTLVTNLSSLHLTYDCLHNRVHKQTDWHRHLSQTMSFHLSPSAHTTHTHNVDWVKCCDSRYWLFTRESSRGRLSESQHEYTNNRLHCVNSSSTACQRRLTTELLQTHNTHLLPLWRDATIRSSSTIPTNVSTAGYSPRVFQPIDDSTKSSHPNLSTRAHCLLSFTFQAGNRREHKVFVFQAIDERSSTNTLNDEQLQQEKDNCSWPRAQLTTHSPTTPTTQPVHARTHAPHTHHIQTQTTRNLCASVMNIVSAQKNHHEKTKRTTHSPYKHKREKTHECHVCTQEKVSVRRKCKGGENACELQWKCVWAPMSCSLL